MKKYYTRVCNFYYGDVSIKLIKQKKTLPLNGSKKISFDQIEILSRNTSKIINIKEVKNLPGALKSKVNVDLKKIVKRNKNFSNLNFNNIPNIMGIINLTPDRGKFNKMDLAIKQALYLKKQGAHIIDIGGESTRPGSKEITVKNEWNRIKKTLGKINKNINLSLDTRKSEIMERGIKKGVKLINDISGLSYDKKTVNILKKYNIPFVIHHIQGKPNNMQKIQNIKMCYWIFMIFLKRE